MHSPALGADVAHASPRAAWLAAIGAIALFGAALGILFGPAIVAAVDVWSNSATFNHCFLVLPVVLWLVALQRHELARLTPTAAPLVLLALMPASLLWLLGHLATVLEVQELAVVAMFQIGLVGILGGAVARALWFPIAYLLFLVPVGEWAVPMLQRITASLAVAGLDLAGVPVFSDGLLIEIPEGKFFVAEACAGMRFLIATLAFGTLFCWLYLHSPRRVALFLAATVLVPILANGVRAFGIVMTGHLYGPDTSVVADHVIYGWGFFALITALLTLIGLRFREAPHHRVVTDAREARPWRWTAAAGVLAIGFAASGPVLAALLALRADRLPEPSRFAAPAAAAPWATQAASAWRPDWHGADAEVAAAYARNDAPVVELRIAYVTHQRKGAEPTAFAGQLGRAPGADLVGQERATITTRGGPLEVVVSHVFDPQGMHLVWHWYWVHGRFTARGATAKLLQLAAELTGRQRPAALVVLATSNDRGAPARLAELLEHLPSLAELLEHAGS